MDVGVDAVGGPGAAPVPVQVRDCRLHNAVGPMAVATQQVRGSMQHRKPRRHVLDVLPLFVRAHPHSFTDVLIP
jgi:hypothetical protein